jgi:hypothetical protein
MKTTSILLPLLYLACIFGNECRADISGLLNCGVTVNVYAPQTQLGSNMVWTIRLINNSTSNQTCVVSRNVDAILYTGKPAGRISNVTTTNTLSPNETNTLNVTVTTLEYSQFQGITKTFQMVTVVEVPATKDVWFAPIGGRIVLSSPRDILTLSPQPPIAVGNCVTTSISYRNPYSTSLTGVKVYLSGDEHFSRTSSRTITEISIGSVAPNTYVNAFTNFTAMSAGTGTVWATITASNHLMDVCTSSNITIIE